MTELSWDLSAHVRGALSEALLAEFLYRRYADTILHPPRHPGYDVSSASGGLRVDAKVASILDVDLDGSGASSAVEWDGGSAANELHESATHLGLVVLGETTSFRLFDGVDAILRGEVRVQGRVFLVPGETVRENARPLWSVQHGRASRGRFRYLRLDLLDPFELTVGAVPSSGEGK